jgi:hypothetical protein
MNKQQFYIEKDGIECGNWEIIPIGALCSGIYEWGDGSTEIVYGTKIKSDENDDLLFGRYVLDGGSDYYILTDISRLRIESINDPKTGNPLYLRRWIMMDDDVKEYHTFTYPREGALDAWIKA